MNDYGTVSYFLQEYLSIYSWQDGVEILFFSALIYTISIWLKQDHSNKLLAAFYSYLGLFCSSYYFSLSTAHSALLYSAPVVGTLLILYHQKQLQKNFILARKQPLEPQKIMNVHWIEDCIRSCLIVAHQKKAVTCIIESADSLEQMIDYHLLLDVQIQKNVLNLILLSDLFQPEKPMWLKRTGTIFSVNCWWNENLVNDSLFSTHSRQPDWQHYGSIITGKTDAILFHLSAEPEQSGICYKGEIIQKMSSDQVLKFIKQVIQKSNKKTVSSQKGNDHERTINNSF
jgi:hypothetical protein